MTENKIIQEAIQEIVNEAVQEEFTLSFGQKMADKVATFVGSWPFVITQTCIIACWVIYNITSGNPLDPFPFVFLNLGLSAQAAYTAPIIMMSQNRQSQLDRAAAKKDYDTNTKAEMEIRMLEKHIKFLEGKLKGQSEELKHLPKILEILQKK